MTLPGITAVQQTPNRSAANNLQQLPLSQRLQLINQIQTQLDQALKQDPPDKENVIKLLKDLREAMGSTPELADISSAANPYAATPQDNQKAYQNTLTQLDKLIDQLENGQQGAPLPGIGAFGGSAFSGSPRLGRSVNNIQKAFGGNPSARNTAGTAGATNSPNFTAQGGVASKLSPELDTHLTKECEKYGVPKELALGVMNAESGFNQDAVSPTGALGLMQLMPKTAEALGVDPRDPKQNITGGVKLLAQGLQKYSKGDLNPSGDPQQTMKLALAAYNAGSGNVDKYKGIPPFRETQHYVTKIASQVHLATAA